MIVLFFINTEKNILTEIQMRVMMKKQGTGLVLFTDWTGSLNESKVLAPDRQSGDQFGYCVSISDDGLTAIIGAPEEDTGASGAGAAYVFKKENGEWIHQQKLQASVKTFGDNFGRAVAISGDGTVIAIGAENDDPKGSSSGSVYICIHNGTSWVIHQRADGDTNYNYFGSSVDISTNGDDIAIGGYGYGMGNNGAIYVYTRENGGNWGRKSLLTANDGQIGDELGRKVSISGNGNTIVAGAANDNGTNANNIGAAYVFHRPTTLTSWTQKQRLQASDYAESDNFGYSVRISGDGNSIVVGAPNDDNSNGINSGSVYVFTYDGNDWIEQHKIITSDGNANDGLGWATAISYDGTVAVFSAPYNDITGGDNKGTLYVYKLIDNIWTLQRKIQQSDAANNDKFGSHYIDITNDSDTIISGTWAHTFDNISSGAAYIYTRAQ